MLLEAIRGPFDRLQHRRAVYLSDALAVSWIVPGPVFTASSRVPIKMASGAFRYQNANGKQCVWWPTRACRGDPLAPYSLRELRPPGLEFCGNSRDLRQWSTERFPVEIGASPSLSCWGLDGCTVGAFFKVQRRPIMHPVKHTKNHAAQPFQPYLLPFDLFSRFLFLLHLGPVQGVTKRAIFFSASVLSSGSEKARSDADPLAVPFPDGKCAA